MAARSCAAPAKSRDESSECWPLSALALWAHLLLKHLCLSYFIDWRETKELKPESNTQPATKKWDFWRSIYVLAWTGALFGLWLWLPEGGFWPQTVVGGIAAYRAYEVAVTGLGTALGDETQFKARNLVTIAFYGLQMVLIFAIIYHSFAGGCFEATSNAPDQSISPSDYLYISWANLTSLGQDSYEAKSITAEFLEVLTTTMGIMLLGVLLAFGINEVKGPTESHPSAQPDSGSKPEGVEPATRGS
jgi:hypothetical protein